MLVSNTQLSISEPNGTMLDEEGEGGDEEVDDDDDDEWIDMEAGNAIKVHQTMHE